MFITRRAEFSASHVCRLPELNDQQNFELYGEEAHAAGHGHNYIVEVTLQGEPDPLTGMVMDLKELKGFLEDEVILPMDHRFLNYEVPPFDKIVPTTANVAREIWRRLEKRVREHASGVARQNAFGLAKVRLFEGPDLFVDVFGVQ